MIVMPANYAGHKMDALLREFPDHVGQLFSPEGWATPKCRFALDNGAFTAYKRGETFPQRKYVEFLEKVKAKKVEPLWAAVPDVVADRRGTLESWREWAPVVASYGFPLCFVVQDGMTPDDIPLDAEVVFIGGTVAWKSWAIDTFCASFPRVHVGRINGRMIWKCWHRGAESCDGTGWMRGNRRQLGVLMRFLRVVSGKESQLPLLEAS